MSAQNRILIIDNFDSFTFNLVDEFAKRGCHTLVHRNHIPLKSAGKIIEDYKPHLIVLSPGPGSPKDTGICTELVREYQGKIPIWGVCLGHQVIVEALGGRVGRAEVVVHGKKSSIVHDGYGLFENLPSPLAVARYHSLCAVSIPPSLEVQAQTSDGMIMAVRKRDNEAFLEGVQFHPESILSTLGGEMIQNLLRRIQEN